MGYFFNKRQQVRKPSVAIRTNDVKEPVKEVKAEETTSKASGKNKKVKKTEETMVENIDKVSALEEIISDEQPVKRVKKDKGLIERTESSKVILTEDNKQLLMD